MTVYNRLKLKQKILVLAFTLLISPACFAQAVCPLDNLKPREVASLESFKKIPIMDQGRIKPLDTYARGVLLRFSGKDSFDRKPAIHWLARLLFAPRATAKDKIFLINNPQVPMALGVKPDKKRRYSFSQLEPGLGKLKELALVANQIEGKKRTIFEKEILRVYVNIHSYIQFSDVFSFALPHPEFTINQPEIIQLLGLPPNQDQASFLDIVLQADVFHQLTENLQSKNQEDWTEQEAGLMQLLKNLPHWTRDHSSLSLAIIPSLKKENDEWISPWEGVHTGIWNQTIRAEILALREIVTHYWNGQQLEFNMAIQAFRNSIEQRANEVELRHLREKLPLEIQYNRFNLFLIARIFYALAFFLFLLSLLSSHEILRRVALAFIVLGFLPHLYALILRGMILSRPPVTTLYETFVFVSFMSVVLGFIIEIINKKWLGIVVAGICGFIFLMIAGKFNADGESMQMLMAVLNSNFWLGTHVLTITVGYAGCCVAGVMGHVYILQGLAHPENKELLTSTHKNILGTLGFGLTMTFLGTALGGIWADESWGRFWGWDPKENGALLIILWCALLFHAKAGKLIGPLGVAVGSILGLIVVMGAWFGVNLLGVGLHSYGFTSGIANTLMIYVGCEMVFLCATIPFLRKKSRRKI